MDNYKAREGLAKRPPELCYPRLNSGDNDDIPNISPERFFNFHISDIPFNRPYPVLCYDKNDADRPIF